MTTSQIRTVMNARHTSSNLFVIPLIVGLLFAALMVYLAISATPTARDHYKSKQTAEKLEKFFRSFNPNPNAPPVKEESWYVRYEINFLVMGLFLSIIGLRLGWMVIGRHELPSRNPLNLSDLMRRSILATVCSFILSPACFLLYIWMLRVGIIS